MIFQDNKGKMVVFAQYKKMGPLSCTNNITDLTLCPTNAESLNNAQRTVTEDSCVDLSLPASINWYRSEPFAYVVWRTFPIFTATKATNSEVMQHHIENNINKAGKWGCCKILHINIAINNHFHLKLSERQLPREHHYHRHYWKPWTSRPSKMIIS